MRLLLTFMAMYCLVYNSIAQQWHPATQPGWNLVYNDEFNINYPHTAISDYKNSFIDTTKWHSNMDWYQGPTVKVNDQITLQAPNFASQTNFCRNIIRTEAGAATIRAQHEPAPYRDKVWSWFWSTDNTECKDTVACHDTLISLVRENGIPKRNEKGEYYKFKEVFLNFNYTTGMLMSKPKFKYGYFEMRMKLPRRSAGFQPNFWLWNSTAKVNWSELDIFEIDALENLHTCNVHYQLMENKALTPHYAAKIDKEFDIKNLDTNYHSYAALWTGDKISIYMDTLLVREYNTIAGYQLEPMAIIIDLYNPAASFQRTELADGNYDFVIDYVRVYQSDNNCNQQPTACTYDMAYNGKLVKNFTASGANCTHTVNQNTRYLANDFVVLQAGFQTTTDSLVFEANTTPCASEYRNNLIVNPFPNPSQMSVPEQQAQFYEQRKTKNNEKPD